MILITSKAHSILQETLEKKGHQVVYEPHITYEELEKIIPQAEGIVVTTRLKIDRNLIDKAIALKWIGRLGSGLELIDTEHAAKKNISSFSSSEGNRNAVGEHALGLVLNLMNNICRSSREVQEYIWKRNENRGWELKGRTVGLVGYGNTGQAFAQLLQPFGVTILAYDKYKEGFAGGLVREVNLEHITRYAEIISFHVPLTEETFHMADKGFFDALKQKPWIINTSRGKVLDTIALSNALKESKISGAALDVLENEKLESLSQDEKVWFEFLRTHPDVLLTPHIAGYTHEAFMKMSVILLEKIEHLL
ncbi:MAG: NAD(P)-dependent oxidoreductase [Ferruginibacter sp.]